VASSPNARRVARQLGVDLAQVSGTGPGGRITSEDVEAHAARPPSPPSPAPAAAGAGTTAAPPAAPAAPAGPTAPPSSPIARKLAERLGVALASVAGSGPGGRITRQDVEAAVRTGGATAAAPAASAAPVDAAGATATAPVARPGPRPGDRIRLTGMRGTIATRMHESLRSMAQLTVGMEVAADRLVALRDQLRDDWADDPDRRLPTYTDFVLRAVASALGEHPLLNAAVTTDAVELASEVHLGLAVALDHGLVVPVIRSADQLSLADIAVESARLSTAAREGRLGPDDLAGGTFSVTSLGSYDIDFFTPVVNPPNVAILGVGRLRDGVAWDGDLPRRARQLTLSLTFDHRAVDGAPAAAFLATVRDLLERPGRLLT
jgi:pyruvate dehydrogenase E2 component (dihydrolipoamide acetyltransferase)